METIAPYPGDRRSRANASSSPASGRSTTAGHRVPRRDQRTTSRAALSPEYDADDVCAIDRGNVFTLGRILPEFLEVDYSGVTEFPIPVLMFMGRHDYTTPSAPTAAWLDKVSPVQARRLVRTLLAHGAVGGTGQALVSLLTYVRPLAVPAGAPAEQACCSAHRRCARWRQWKTPFGIEVAAIHRNPERGSLIRRSVMPLVRLPEDLATAIAPTRAGATETATLSKVGTSIRQTGPGRAQQGARVELVESHQRTERESKVGLPDSPLTTGTTAEPKYRRVLSERSSFSIGMHHQPRPRPA